MSVKIDNIEERYDFSDECIKTKEYNKLKGYAKYFAYRSTESKSKDPDTNSKLLQEIYKVLWTEELTNEQYMRNEKWIQSDTMTSVQNTLNNYVKEKLETAADKYMDKNKEQRYISAKMCREMYENKKEIEEYGEVKDKFDKDEGLEEFVSIYHTIGNYTPVPRFFNRARSGPGCESTYDYWDLTLMKIKEIYAEKAVDNNQIMQLLHCKVCDEKVINCRKWLEYFKTWKNFIEQNYFQDYVDDKLEVKPFCTSHSWDNIEINNYQEFFENANNCIKLRGARIIKVLGEKLKESSNKKED